MTINELYEACKEAVEKGKGDKPVLFDSEAACFDVHMVKLQFATYEDEPDFSFLCLSFDRNEPYHYNVDPDWEKEHFKKEVQD